MSISLHSKTCNGCGQGRSGSRWVDYFKVCRAPQRAQGSSSLSCLGPKSQGTALSRMSISLHSSTCGGAARESHFHDQMMSVTQLQQVGAEQEKEGRHCTVRCKVIRRLSCIAAPAFGRQAQEWWGAVQEWRECERELLSRMSTSLHRFRSALPFPSSSFPPAPSCLLRVPPSHLPPSIPLLPPPPPLPQLRLPFLLPPDLKDG